jgi:AbrB family looped-hinge helix DNA binding protein
MDIAKVSLRGQLVLPTDVRKRLNLKEGDKVVFFVENGRVVVENATMLSVRKAQDDFEGEASRAGLTTKQDLVKMMKEG